VVEKVLVEEERMVEEAPQLAQGSRMPWRDQRVNFPVHERVLFGVAG